MESGNYPRSRQENIVIQELREETLIYDLQKNKALCLNKTSAMVWQLCDGNNSVAEISQIISKKLNTHFSEDIVWLALNQFKNDNLLSESSKFVTPLDGLNRREIVRRIGFASIVALPIISSIVAPTALRAQSAASCGPIGNCTGGSTGVCTCTPPVQPGNNNNPEGCRCLTNGDCQGNCVCGNPCQADPCPSGETCQSGVCNGSGVSCGVGFPACPSGQICSFGQCGLPCNGNCPSGTTCITDTSQSNYGTCSGVCLSSPFNFCIGGNSNPFCIPNNGGNLSAPCCPCSIDGDCAGSCSNNNQGPPGVCI